MTIPNSRSIQVEHYRSEDGGRTWTCVDGARFITRRRLVVLAGIIVAAGFVLLMAGVLDHEAGVVLGR